MKASDRRLWALVLVIPGHVRDEMRRRLPAGAGITVTVDTVRRVCRELLPDCHPATDWTAVTRRIFQVGMTRGTARAA